MGWGEAGHYGPPEPVAAAIQHNLAPRYATDGKSSILEYTAHVFLENSDHIKIVSVTSAKRFY